jgi:hypothetical protein
LGNARRVQQDLVHQAEYRCIPAYAKRHNGDGEQRKAWTPEEIPTRVPEITQEMIDVVHAAHIAAFLLVLFHSIHCAKGCGTSIFWREPSRHFHLDAFVNVKLELLLELLFDAISLAQRSNP